MHLFPVLSEIVSFEHLYELDIVNAFPPGMGCLCLPYFSETTMSGGRRINFSDLNQPVFGTIDFFMIVFLCSVSFSSVLMLFPFF